MKKKKFNWDWVTIAFLIVAFCIFLKGTLDLKYWDSRLFPLIVLALVAVLTIVMIIHAIRDPAPEYNFASGKRAILFGLSLLVYALVIYLVGFYIASPLYMGIMMYLMGQRSRKVIVGVSLCITLFIFVTFDLIMRIPVPAGLLFK